MNRLRWHLLPLLLLAFLSFLAFNTVANAQQHDVQDQVPLADKEPFPTAQFGEEGVTDTEPRDDVREALSILRKIKPPTTSKLARYTRKPKGFVGSSVFYAKKAFELLFLNSPNPADLLSLWTSTSSTKSSGPLAKAVNILQDAANDNDVDAIYLLAEMNFHGNFSHPVNYEEAFAKYKQLADLTGNSTAQYMLGFMYATGLNPAIPADQAKSMLYHSFAADQGDTRSEMTLAYRYHAGIATPKSCEDAVVWYKKVADKAVEYYRSGPPGGHVLVRDAYRLADENGGPYGEGASVSSSGQNAKQGGPTSDAYADIDDVMEYLYLKSIKGDDKATLWMARMHYDGSRGLKRDLKLAKRLFLSLARKYWAENGKVVKGVSPLTEKLATKSAGYLGRMSLRGEGTEQNYARARVWFKRAVANGDALSQYSLGLMHLNGLGMTQDVSKAATYLAAAADQNLAVAQTHLGILFLDQGDHQTAALYFDLAARNSHIEAFWYLAEMNNNAIGRDRSCGAAAAYYKTVVEKAETIWSSLHEANEAFDEGDNRRALIGYLMAAEQGSENSQANVAWLLDQTKPKWSLIAYLSSFQERARAVLSHAETALIYWTRSAKQNNIDSLVKMGDYYLSGLGTSISAENAAACYQAAAETQFSAQAMWNLGWMHENGLGIEQDFHLAKRLYDQALETNKEAYLPVKLSLWKLRWRSWWNRVTRGSVPGIEGEEDAGSRRKRSLAEWVQDFLEADAAYYYDQLEADEWDAHGDGDDVLLPGGEGYYMEDDEFDDDGLLETLFIGTLIAALGGLIWYRRQQQRAAEERQRQGIDGAGQQQQQPAPPPPPGQQPDGGFFPQPGDPNRNAWLAGAFGP